MRRDRLYRAEGIVLRQFRLGEADRIITLFTAEHGKLRAVAKGVRKTRSRLAGHLEPLTRVQVQVAKGKSLDIISQALTIDAHMPLRTDLWRMTCALYMAELVDRFWEESSFDLVESHEMYGLFASSLRWLTMATSTDLVLRFFEVHLLDQAGYRPEIDRCIRCSQPPVSGGTYRFWPGEGGIVCGDCAEHGGGRRLSPQAIETIQALSAATPLEADRLDMPDGIHVEIRAVLRDYIRHLLSRELNSTALMEELRLENARRNGQDREAAPSVGRP